MVELEAWYEPGQEEPLILREQVDVDAMFDRMLSWAATDPVPPMAEIDFVGGEHWAVLHFGVRTDRGFVSHVDPSGSVVSSSGRSEPARVTYDYMGEATPVQGNTEVPVSLIRQAVRDFVRTRGSRPEGIAWQEVSR